MLSQNSATLLLIIFSYAWRDGLVQLVISQEILREYWKMGEVFAEEYHSIDLGPILDLVTVNAEMYYAEELPKPVCSEPDDDKFLACTIASGSKVIISGDKHLLKVNGYQKIEIIKPQEFLKRYLQK